METEENKQIQRLKEQERLLRQATAAGKEIKTSYIHGFDSIASAENPLEREHRGYWFKKLGFWYMGLKKGEYHRITDARTATEAEKWATEQGFERISNEPILPDNIRKQAQNNANKTNITLYVSKTEKGKWSIRKTPPNVPHVIVKPTGTATPPTAAGTEPCKTKDGIEIKSGMKVDYLGKKPSKIDGRLIYTGEVQSVTGQNKVRVRVPSGAIMKFDPGELYSPASPELYDLETKKLKEIAPQAKEAPTAAGKEYKVTATPREMTKKEFYEWLKKGHEISTGKTKAKYLRWLKDWESMHHSAVLEQVKYERPVEPEILQEYAGEDWADEALRGAG